MDEYMTPSNASVTAPISDVDAPTAETEKVATSSNLSTDNNQPKRYTLKSARTALRRMEADLEKKNEQIAVLKKEIADLKPQIRAMSVTVEQLEKAETERKVHDALRMKSKHMTGNQVLAALNLVQHLNGDLDGIDIDELARVIRTAVQDKRQDQPTSTTQAGEVATSGNFSAANNGSSGTSFDGERRVGSDGNV